MTFLQKLIDNFRKFPSVGPKQAERFAMHILKASEYEIDELINSILEVKKNVKRCIKCNNYSVNDLCDICSDNSRIKKLCIVETPFDLISIEKTKAYAGRYFVLGSNFVPLDNSSDFNNKIEKIKTIIKEDLIDEVIIALDATTEGQITSIYLKKMLLETKVNITRIAYGIPLGADIDYMDGFTLSHALKKRVPAEED